MTARRSPRQPAGPGHTGVVTERDSPPAEKRVTWAELFFDLVFVFAVTEVSTLISHDRSGAGLLRAVIVFVPCYWLWVGTSIQVNQRDISRPSLRLLSYGHLSFIAAIIMVAVGMHQAVIQPGDPLGVTGSALLAGGTALYLATFGFTRWAMFRLVSWTRLTAAGAVLLLLPVAPHVPALATLTAMAVILVVLNTVELMRVEQIGWWAKISGRAHAR